VAIEKLIEETLERSVCGGWDRGFLESVLSQLSKGRSLSAKQKQTLGKVLSRNTEEDQKVHESWTTVYESRYKADAAALAAYHQHQSYYRPMAADILAGKVPERGKFLRMYDNKYSKKVLAQHTAIPKYEVGAYVQPRSHLDSYKDIEFESDMVWSNQKKIVQDFKKRGGFIIEICKEIRSAAKGAKRYKILPIGATMPFIVEERHIKLTRKYQIDSI
jgi:hypothetical protein